ncbi:MAG: alpha/beta fold hydrolase [Burkholderiales bacterium]
MSVSLRAFAALVLLFAAGLPAADAAPCVTATEACGQWLTLDAGGAKAFVYATQPLGTRNPAITRALVLVHGAQRNADAYFRTAVAAASQAGALDDTLVIAPRFSANDGRACKDTLAAGEINWPCAGNSWRAGGAVRGNPALTSFDFADAILRALANKDAYPNLARIVFAGHSGGAQFAVRYAMANQVHDSLGVPVTYVVASPSSYAYLDASRPVPDTAGCTGYNRWPYGLQGRRGYAARLTDSQLRKQFLARPVSYLVGALDTQPNYQMDTSCPAMMQGPQRLARTQAFVEALGRNYRSQPPLLVVAGCGHEQDCVLRAAPVLPVLFPRSP